MNFTITQPTAALNATRKLGATLPTALESAEARANNIVKAAGNMAPPPHELLNAIIRAVDNGKAPADDKDVQRMLHGQALANDAVLHGLRSEAAQLLTEALIEHQGALFKAWRTVFDKATTDLHTAHQVLGHANLADTDTIVRMGPEASTAWSTANNAMIALRDVMAAWQGWATATRQADTSSAHAVLRIADIDWNTYREHQLGGTVDYWKLVQLGISFSLADAQTYKHRVAELQAQQRAEAAAAQAARLERMQLN